MESGQSENREDENKSKCLVPAEKCENQSNQNHQSVLEQNTEQVSEPSATGEVVPDSQCDSW